MAPEEKQTNVIYQINYADCSWKYIGERGRSLETRKKEQMRNVRKCKVGSNTAKHAWDNDYAIDFANCKVIDREIFVTEEHCSGVSNSIIGGGGGGHIFIYSCSAQLISFEINCFLLF